MIACQDKPPLPGSVLLSDYIKPRQLQIKALATLTGVSRKHIYKILNGEVRITPAMSARLALALSTSAGFWVALQSAVDIYQAEREFDHFAAADHEKSDTFKAVAGPRAGRLVRVMN